VFPLKTAGHHRRMRGGAGLLLLLAGIGVSSFALADSTQDKEKKTTGVQAQQRLGYAPDPAPIRSATQWLLTFEYHRGKVRLLQSRLVRYRNPITTPRRIGRFAVELLSGPTVVERLRFDFPLLGADELAGQKRPYNAPPHFETKARIVHRVMLPDTPRASRARLVDRATGESFMLPWPPNQVLPPAPPKPDAGHDTGAGDAASDSRADVPNDGDGPDAWRRPDVGERKDSTPPDVVALDAGKK
jgi:hypothetical protein